MRLHVVSLPHTETTRDYDWCAYTGKVRKFCTMMLSQGYEVYLYAGEDNEAECTEHIELVSQKEQAKWFGHYDWSRDVFNDWDVKSEWWREMNHRAVQEISKRSEPGDMLGIIAGWCQEPIASALPKLRAVEWGIGYEGVFAPFRVFESYAWAHHIAGMRRMQQPPEPEDVRYFDTVIPNFFEPVDFPLGEGGKYLLFVGRLTPRKGLDTVSAIQEATGLPLMVAGQGDHTLITAPHEYVGVVKPAERAELMGGAQCLLAPTTYLEPFGGVTVEAMLCGTPAITTDWGGFTETIDPRFRCRTLQQFVEAVDLSLCVARPVVRFEAIQRFSVDNVRHQYDFYLKRLKTLDDKGWYQLGR